MNIMNIRRICLLLLLAATAPLAGAHTGADAAAHHGFVAGVLHPFTGLDHLAAMLAVGLWSALLCTRWSQALRAPLSFAGVLLLGALLGAAGLTLPAVEPMIAASLLVLGLLVAARQGLPAPFAMALVAVFALFHGAAHGQELAGAGALAGMVLATALLHGAGLALGLVLRTRSVWWPRLAGAATALFGAALLLG